MTSLKKYLFIIVFLTTGFSYAEPIDILIGTDVIKMKDITIPNDCTENSILGKFSADTGGASSEIVVTGMTTRKIVNQALNQ